LRASATISLGCRQGGLADLAHQLSSSFSIRSKLLPVCWAAIFVFDHDRNDAFLNDRLEQRFLALVIEIKRALGDAGDLATSSRRVAAKPFSTKNASAAASIPMVGLPCGVCGGAGMAHW
jgi:hypothetical protein